MTPVSPLPARQSNPACRRWKVRASKSLLQITCVKQAPPLRIRAMITQSIRIPLLALLTTLTPAHAALHSYYVGTDNAPLITSGTYSGQPNPNYNRLTFLLAHTYP